MPQQTCETDHVQKPPRNPLEVVVPRKPWMSHLQTRFWRKVEITDTGCWQWTASKQKEGYGQFRVGDRMIPAHRVAIRLFVKDGDDILDQCQEIRHRCPEDNPSCCNPEHLWPGTVSENQVDSLRDGNRGEFSSGQIRHIRRRYDSGETQSDIADDYGVSQRCISLIVRGETYEHVEMPK